MLHSCVTGGYRAISFILVTPSAHITQGSIFATPRSVRYLVNTEIPPLPVRPCSRYIYIYIYVYIYMYIYSFNSMQSMSRYGMYMVLWIMMIAIGCSSISVSRYELLKIRQNITSHVTHEKVNTALPVAFQHKVVGSSEIFFTRKYANYTGNLPIYVILGDYRQVSMGNSIGRILNDLGCAEKAGLHTIVVNRHYSADFRDEYWKIGLHFVQVFSSVYPHPHPNTLEMATEYVKTHCKCRMFCWTDLQSPWIDYILPLRDIFNRALPSHFFQTPTFSGQPIEVHHDDAPEPISHATTITTSSLTHTTTAMEEGTPMPIVPDIAIQLRCSDNTPKMGLLPFQAIFDRLDRYFEEITKQKHRGQYGDINRTKLSADKSVSQQVYIYIMSEHVDRTFGVKKLGHVCPHVLIALHEQLSKRYEDSVVSILKGHMFRTWYQFMHAKVVICGASTFCLWPALANSNGTVYLPMTPLIANNTAVQFKGVSNVHFIEDYELYNIAQAITEKDYRVVVNALSSSSRSVAR